MDAYERILPDSSVIVEGLLSTLITDGTLRAERILIHEAVIAELEHQANENRTTGFIGLSEIQRLGELAEEHDFELAFIGQRPANAQIRMATKGEIDAMIRQSAFEEDADFFTADAVQARVAQAKNMRTRFFEKSHEQPSLLIEDYFDADTMSVHLAEGVVPIAKVGRPGEWGFRSLDKKELTRERIIEISTQIVEQAGKLTDAFLEIERPGSTIVQLGRYRIVITRPPFSDGWEITAVRPVAQLGLADYHLSDKLHTRLAQHAEGILIAGSPGMGKSTFAAALAAHYAEQGKIVKTIEAPRDLVLPKSITQYAISHAQPGEVHDILLLSRPDYTLFDEMRTTHDFALFADLRLSGIGLAGVVHATNPIDAIQRFVGRIELGMIPQIIDTVVFIRDGKPAKVLSLSMTVKVPEGMTEADLARPVVVVNDFETSRAEYELYTYGEQTVVIPVSEVKKDEPAHLKLAAQAVRDFFSVYAPSTEVEMESASRAIVYVPERAISAIIGKGGNNISRIESDLGVKVDIRPLSEYRGEEASVPFTSKIGKGTITLSFENASNRQANIFVGGEYLMNGQVGKDGSLKVSTKHKAGRALARALNARDPIRVEIR